MTAAQLAAALGPFAPVVELQGGALSFRLRRDTPANLARAFAVLRTGVAAVKLGRAWYGCDSATGRAVVLSPAGLVPEGITLLSVEGCARWDRVHWSARPGLPALFVAPTPASSPRRLARQGRCE